MNLLRPLLRIVAVVLVVAAGAYAAYWFVTANRLQTGLQQWAAARRADGYTVAWHDQAVAGFPFAFRLSLQDAAIGRGNAYHAAVPEVVGTASPLDLRRWHFVAARGASGTVQGIEATITARSLRGDLVLGDNDNSFTLSVLQLAGAGASAGQLTLAATVPRQPPRSHREVGLTASAQLFHLTLPRAVTALGDTVESCAVDLQVMGALPAGDWRQALARWRDEGGVVELNRAFLQWGALQLEANGTVALDSALQPIASLSATVMDHKALVDAAVAAGMLPARNADVVKLVLDLLAHRGANGASRLTAPITIQDGKIAIGRAEIGKIPRLDWK
jgi:hypothetical protein